MFDEEEEPAADSSAGTSTDGTATKSKTTATLLAVFGGIVGAHHFYLSNVSKGIVYLLASWTLIPIFLGWRDAYRLGLLSDRGFAQIYDGLDVTDVDDGPLVAESVSGRVELHDDHVRLSHRNGTTKRIPLDRINAVEFSDRPGSTGYIQFEQTAVQSLPTGVSGAREDENSITFRRVATEQFEQFRDAVEAAMFDDGNDNDAIEPETSADEPDEAIETLRNQFAMGELSEEEFEQRKAVLEGN